ncbi:monoacylglycerol lipase ABHD6-like [Elgaria multicarinata webbii]|uniref:monoacylglycerol lipase ABHD6-like n=1 Tax=Elgaria multicarinata webbii TaxID=159646 RepID=UPI002FCCEA9C
MDFSLLKIFLVHISIFVGILLISVVTTYFLWPSALIILFKRYVYWRNGLKLRYAEHEGYKFCYFFRGKPSLDPSFLMLHGFALSKDMWLLSIVDFPKDIHLICVDLPGHGETTCLPGDSCTALDQAKRLHQFTECIGLNRKPFHLAGISMGGMVAGVYAALYPSDVCSLSLLCPAGLRYPTDNEFVRHLKKLEESHKVEGNNPLLPLNKQQTKELFKLGAYYQLPLPQQIVNGFLELRQQDHKFYEKCFLDFSSGESRYHLHDNMSKIRAPTQIIWGKDDKILDPYGAEILANAIPNTQVHLLEKCGHFMLLDWPKEISRLLLDFYKSICCMKNKKTA